LVTVGRAGKFHRNRRLVTVGLSGKLRRYRRLVTVGVVAKLHRFRRLLTLPYWLVFFYQARIQGEIAWRRFF